MGAYGILPVFSSFRRVSLLFGGVCHNRALTENWVLKGFSGESGASPRTKEYSYWAVFWATTFAWVVSGFVSQWMKLLSSPALTIIESVSNKFVQLKSRSTKTKINCYWQNWHIANSPFSGHTLCKDIIHYTIGSSYNSIRCKIRKMLEYILKTYCLNRF